MTSEKAIKQFDVVRERSRKQSMTAEELRGLDDQAQALWQANDRAAKRDVATDRGLRNAPNCAISLGHRPDRYMARGGVIIDEKPY